MPQEPDVRTTEAAIDRLAGTIRRAASLRQSFMRGLIGGLGTAIGATVVAAIVFGLLSGFLSEFGLADLLPSGARINAEP